MFDKDNKFGFISNNNESNNNIEGLDKVKTDINNIKDEVNELNTQYKDIAKKVENIEDGKLISTTNIVKNKKNKYALLDDSIFTLAEQTDASTITNGKTYKSIIAPDGEVQPYFRYSSQVVRAGDVYPLYGAVNSTDNTTITIEFMSNCTEIEIMGQSCDYGFEIDGVQYPNKIVFAKKFQKLTFTNNKMKHFKIYTTKPARFFGVIIDTRASLISYSHKRLLCAFDGDSFFEGTGSTFPSMWGMAQRICQLFDWDMYNVAYGGTGYLNPGSGGRVPIGDDARTNVLSKIQPDILIVSCGINDSLNSDRTEDSLKQAVDDYYKKIKTLLPNTEVIILSPISPSNTEYEKTNRMFLYNQLKESAKKYGYCYINVVFGETYDKKGNLLISGLGDWKDGEGNVSSVKDTGNRSIYINKDNTHPTQEGHDFLGMKIANEIYRIFQTL